MKLATAICWILLPALSVLAKDRPTDLTLDGQSYRHITDVHVSSEGRIVILYSVGGIALDPSEVPQSFLKAWDIDPAEIKTNQNPVNDSVSAWLDHQRELVEEQRRQAQGLAGDPSLIREIDGVVYDLNKPQPGWEHFTGAKLVAFQNEDALMDITPGGPGKTLIVVRNLKKPANGEPIDFYAKLLGNLPSHAGTEGVTIRLYDAGKLHSTEAAAVVETHPSAPVKTRSSGSGFMISEDGYLLTNFHVVRDAKTVQVKIKDLPRYVDAEIVTTDQVNDLALLKIAGSGFKAVPISDQSVARLGEDVFTIGFPNPDVQGIDPKYTSGKISSMDGMHDDPRHYQISVPVQPGNSGGPLCNSKGEVVGIVVGRLNDMAILTSSGGLPQNVNYAIKVEYARQLLQRFPTVRLRSADDTPPSSDPVQSVTDSVAMILAF